MKRPRATWAESIYDIEFALLNILPRLPPADLCRCKSVCKDWNARLVPYVISTRTTTVFLTGTAGYISFSDADGTVRSDLRLPPPSLYNGLFLVNHPEPRVTKFLGICNGMPFAAVERKRRRGSSLVDIPEFSFSVDYIVLLSPETGRLFTVHTPRVIFSEDFAQLAFDPTASSERFKIVSVRLINGRANIYLYSSLTNIWRPINFSGDAPPNLSHYCQPQSYCFKGVAYKLAGTNFVASTSINADYTKSTIMALDVEGERLFWITSPPYPNDQVSRESRSCIALGEAAGHLCFGVHVAKKLISTWILVNDGVWSHTHNINLQVAPAHPLLLSSNYMISIFFHPLDVNAVFLTNGGPHIFVADLKTLEVRSITQGGDQELFRIGSEDDDTDGDAEVAGFIIEDEDDDTDDGDAEVAGFIIEDEDVGSAEYDGDVTDVGSFVIGDGGFKFRNLFPFVLYR